MLNLAMLVEASAKAYLQAINRLQNDITDSEQSSINETFTTAV
jgi:tetrahydromethanopterin S-methyltransferase subunit F